MNETMSGVRSFEYYVSRYLEGISLTKNVNYESRESVIKNNRGVDMYRNAAKSISLYYPDKIGKFAKLLDSEDKEVKEACAVCLIELMNTDEKTKEHAFRVIVDAAENGSEFEKFEWTLFLENYSSQIKLTSFSDLKEFDELTKESMDEESHLNYTHMKMCEKCRYGEEIDKLTEKERVIFTTQELSAEVHNGGFFQFYENSSGDYANEVIDALKTLGAEKVLSICQKANSIFGESVPTDRNERNTFLTQKLTSEQEKTLEECDEEFYEAYEELSELSCQYMKEWIGKEEYQ